MRLAFWRAGKVGDVVQRAVGPRVATASGPAVSKPAAPKPAAPKPAAPQPVIEPKSIVAPESGDLDLHALGQALLAKRSLIIVPTVLVAVLSIAAVNMVTPPVQIGSAHPGRWPRERVPAAERRAQ